MSAKHKGEYPCPCRGCVKAYKQGYTDGYNEAMALHQNLDVADWMYGKRLEEGIVTVEQAREWNQHGKGENP